MDAVAVRMYAYDGGVRMLCRGMRAEVAPAWSAWGGGMPGKQRNVP